LLRDFALEDETLTAMKTLLLATSLLLAAAVATPAFALPEESNTDPAEPTITVALKPGTPRDDVRTLLGTPSTMLDPNVWVYWDFQAKGRPAKENHDALIVVFRNDCVSLVKLADSRPVRAFIAQREKAKSAGTAVASK
jgi:outer membrane protein assembly factor BamE (lipoprotein component of BamABCDE complex)